jgi:nucleotide-binding universal stress UspA family protein
MYRSLLVPLDGSQAAEHALPMALTLARRFSARLTVVHVHVPPRSLYGQSGFYNEPADRELRALGETYLNVVLARLAAVTAVPVDSAFLDGPVVDAINHQIEKSAVDLIVMTTQGRGPVARFLLGSVGDLMLRQSTVPILFLRPKETDVDLAETVSFRRLLIPLDGSPLAEQILEPVISLAAKMPSEIVLLRVVELLMPEGYALAGSRVTGLRPDLVAQLQEAGRREQAQAKEYLDQLSTRLRTRSLNVQTRVVSHIQPATAILDDAATHDVDLIALATHGQGGLKRWLVGSVADKVVRGAGTPVFVYRPVGEFDEPAH